MSVDYRHGTTTGISAHDRATTIRALADPALQAEVQKRSAPIIDALVKSGCPTPFPIQADTLPDTLAGRRVSIRIALDGVLTVYDGSPADRRVDCHVLVGDFLFARESDYRMTCSIFCATRNPSGSRLKIPEPSWRM